MNALALDSCCDALHVLRSSRYATEGLKRDLRDEVEFRQARLTAQGKKLRASIDMYGRDATACLRDGNESLARQLVSQKVAMQNRLAHISTHWGVLESVRASLQPGARRCLEDVETCRLIIAKAQLSDVTVRRPGEEDADGVDESDVNAQMVKLRELAKKEPRSALCGVPVRSFEPAGESPAKAFDSGKAHLLIDLPAGSDSGSVHSSEHSDEQLLCTGEGSARSGSSQHGGSSHHGSPPATPPRAATTPPVDIFAFARKAE